MREAAFVSIITPSFNSSKFINETIESVQAQSFTDWEMIIIDDASTDESVKVIESYSISDSRIKLIKLFNNVGAGEARNKGLEVAAGKYIAFLDSDDRWSFNKLEKQIEFMENLDIPICFTGYSIKDENMVVLRISSLNCLISSLACSSLLKSCKISAP